MAGTTPSPCYGPNFNSNTTTPKSATIKTFHFPPSHQTASSAAAAFFQPQRPLTTSSPLPFSSSLSSHKQCRCCLNRVPRVSMAPAEYVSPAPDLDFHSEITQLRELRSRLHSPTNGSIKLKHRVLDSEFRVTRFFFGSGSGHDVFAQIGLDSYELYLLKCLVAAGQEQVLTYGFNFGDSSSRSSLKTALYALAEMIESWDSIGNVGMIGGNSRKKKKVVMRDDEIRALRNLLKVLREMEEFYDCIGGIIGYQIAVLELLAQTPTQATSKKSQQVEESNCQFLEIHPPSGLDLSRNTEYASQAALWGIEGLPDLGEIYPLGGSADRLGLVDPDSGECLPAAMLPFSGHTLLEGLIRDLQAREFLYFKLYGKQCITPVAVMTSGAKNNHDRVTSLCEKLEWFGRGQSSFLLFEQPLVPAIGASNAEWLVAEPFTPVSKPGGHGVLWKLAYDKGVFRWFYAHGRKGATVRQASNVVAATDVTLLALAGIGLHHKKKLGFASCQQSSGATEGINVLMEKKKLDGTWAYGLSCIEYTEFEKFGISDKSCSPNSWQVKFPANTNIMYVDLPAAEQVASSQNVTSLPGMVLNTKKPIRFTDHYGMMHSVLGGRLECTMQNIADNFHNTLLHRCYNEVEDGLDTYMVYNERRKVTSSAKKQRRPGDISLRQTPDGALLDITRNAYDLLSHCNIELPEVGSDEAYIQSGPPFLIFLHPALGPLWEVTRQKFNGGAIAKGSELQVEVTEFYWTNVQLDGSMIIVAENVMGSMKSEHNKEPILHYGHRCARCKLKNVRVINKGIDWDHEANIYWKHEVQRNETLKIVLHGNAEFDASDVTLEGTYVFEVPDGYKLKISSNDTGLLRELCPIEDDKMDSGSWFWNYKIEDAHIKLNMVEL